ncbi:PHP domain-containing protein [Candidatus Woesearchaeota archaeon]|nr:PHP domain-containing protein [Candidatus Woesearchaeota archaeon]
MQQIFIEKPNLKLLHHKDLVPVDMHFHTKYSDTVTRVDSILKRCRKLGVGVAITDHNIIKGYQEARKKNQDVMLIPGIEVTTAEAMHILFYFYSGKDLEHFHQTYIAPNMGLNPYLRIKLNALEIMEAAAEYSSIHSMAHPFAPAIGIGTKLKRGTLDPALIKKIKIAEAICGQNLERMNLQAVKWILENNYGFTGGSDGHSLHNLGAVVTASAADDVTGFLENIRKKRNIIVGKSVHMVSRLAVAPFIINKHLPYMRPYIMDHCKKRVNESLKYHIPRLKSRLKQTMNKVSIRKMQK